MIERATFRADSFDPFQLIITTRDIPLEALREQADSYIQECELEIKHFIEHDSEGLQAVLGEIVTGEIPATYERMKEAVERQLEMLAAEEGALHNELDELNLRLEGERNAYADRMRRSRMDELGTALEMIERTLTQPHLMYL